MTTGQGWDEMLSGYQDWLNELLFEHKGESDQVTWLGDNRWLVIPIEEAKNNLFVISIKRAKLDV